MEQLSQPPNFVGIDVSKDRLDVHVVHWIRSSPLPEIRRAWIVSAGVCKPSRRR